MFLGPFFVMDCMSCGSSEGAARQSAGKLHSHPITLTHVSAYSSDINRSSLDVYICVYFCSI